MLVYSELTGESLVFHHAKFHFAMSMSNGYETVKLDHEIIDGPSYTGWTVLFTFFCQSQSISNPHHAGP